MVSIRYEMTEKRRQQTMKRAALALADLFEFCQGSEAKDWINYVLHDQGRALAKETSRTCYRQLKSERSKNQVPAQDLRENPRMLCRFPPYVPRRSRER